MTLTPKEKAFSLFSEYASRLNDGRIAKRCALIAVDEMIAFSKHAFSFIHADLATPSIQYLEEVKQEIEKL